MENLEEKRIQLPLKELLVLKKKLERLDSLSDEVVSIEKALEDTIKSRSLRIPMERPSIASRPLAEVAPGVSTVQQFVEVLDRVASLKTKREVAFRQMADFLKGLSFSKLFPWASQARPGQQAASQISQALELAAAEAAVRPPALPESQREEFPETRYRQGDPEESRRGLIRELAKNLILDQEPALGSEEVARFLGSTSRTNLRQLASDRRNRGDLLGVQVNGRYLYPAFQFDESRQAVYPIVKEVNKILSSDSDPWGVFSWWVSPNARLADNPAPKMLLSDPDKHSMLRSLAQAVVEDAG